MPTVGNGPSQAANLSARRCSILEQTFEAGLIMSRGRNLALTQVSDTCDGGKVKTTSNSAVSAVARILILISCKEPSDYPVTGNP